MLFVPLSKVHQSAEYTIDLNDWHLNSYKGCLSEKWRTLIFTNSKVAL